MEEDMLIHSIISDTMRKLNDVISDNKLLKDDQYISWQYNLDGVWLYFIGRGCKTFGNKRKKFIEKLIGSNVEEVKDGFEWGCVYINEEQFNVLNAVLKIYGG